MSLASVIRNLAAKVFGLMARNKSTYKTCPDGTVVRANQKCPIPGGTSQTPVYGTTVPSALTGTFTLAENAAQNVLAGTLGGVTSGSTLSLLNNAGGRVALSGSDVVRGLTSLDYETATSHSFTVRETNAGEFVSPGYHDTVLTLSVTNVNDTNPNAFILTDVLNASTATLYTSNAITVSGLSAYDTATASISGDASSQLQKNNGAWGSSPITVSNGDVLVVRHTSSSSSAAPVNTTLTIGNKSDTFTSTTVGAGTVSGVTYDTRIGNGVDANGYANLPLRSGAVRYYVGNGGSDGAAGTSHATRLATVDRAVTLVTQNNGDQVVVAEGSSFSTQFPFVRDKHGYSRLYPTVIQSYDPADPTNESKMGRAIGANRPVFTAPMTGGLTVIGAATNPMQNFVLRGLDFNPGNIASQSLFIGGSNNLSPHGILIENNLFRYTQVTVGGQAGKLGANDIVIRGNGFYGSWSAGSFCQGLYASAGNNYCIEDNVLWHCGHKIGGNRDDASSLGGPTIFNHNLYFQDDAAGIIRRNLTIQGAATGLSTRGHVDLTGNVAINNPVSIIGGLGTQYNSKQPYGVAVFMGFNAIVGSEDLSTASPRGTGYHTGNGKSGSAMHHNLAVKARPGGTPVGALFSAQANYPMPSYANWHDNVGYQWSVSGNSYTFTSGSVDGVDYSSYASANATRNNNYWDDPAAGTNTNISSLSGVVTAYTAASLCTSLGFADAPTAFAFWAANPDRRPAQTLRNTVFTGYGRPTAAPLDALLLAHDWFMVGTPAVALIMGAQDGSTLSATGLPSCFTLDGHNRTLTYDGTGTATNDGTAAPTDTGTLAITETPIGGSPRTTNIPYQLVSATAAPTLSSAASAFVSSGSISITVTTDTPRGTLYWICGTNSNPPGEFDFIVDGLDATVTRQPSNQRGSVTVSSTGAKTITVTGLTPGTTYYGYFTQIDPLFQNSNIASCPGRSA